MRWMLTLLVLLTACDAPRVEAQTSGGGIVKIFTDGTSMAGAGTNGDRIRSLVTMSTGLFGDGSDGACHFDGIATVLGMAPITGAGLIESPLDAYEIYLLPRDLFCSTVVVDNNVLLDTYDNRLFASVSITLNGNALLGPIGCPGYSGGGANLGQNGCGPTSAGTIPTSMATAGAGHTGAGGVGGNSAGPLPLGDATAGGAGGNGVAAGGGGGTTAGGFSATQGDLHTLYTCLTGRTSTTAPVGAFISATGGGGGGDNGTHHGGGGGGGGGYLVVASPRIITNSTSTLTAAAGHGGAGATGGGATGGGGGGGGGVACVVIGGGVQPAITVAGGAGGAGGSGGAAGSAGHAGIVLGPSGGAWVVGVQ